MTVSVGAGRGGDGTDQVILSVDRVSKRFCRGLRRSLRYAVFDIAAEVARIEALGAARTPYEGEGWVQLTDPAGMPFCVTHNNPDGR